ncbi:Phloem protein 2-like protein [Artemisia annua]|uniref:non-specific serine/threonine protein kinase n=1 Tax=Artemisia annua TaxID=35608 RepID=A0A2U1L643_ARTAN|nr:Phloem protein 2-like protein [Artemisia annua]
MRHLKYINYVLSLEEFSHFRIPLEEIKLATNNFSPDNVISLGSDETVYKGEIIRGGKPLPVRVKVQRLHNVPFMKLHLCTVFRSRFENPNIMSLLGLCSEDDKIISVLEHSAYGSLQNYLDNSNLTWKNRLKISAGAARAISNLHKVLYSDFGFTSSSIFLDTNWEAKVSHFESIFETDSVYSDPESEVYGGESIRESDIYSLGIVLFEVLCGRLAFDAEYESDSQYLMKVVEQSYKEGNLDEIIDPFLKNQMAPDSLSTFSNIAYQCCNKSSWLRPKIDNILQELEQAVAHQLEFEELALLHVDDGVEGIPMVQDDYYKEKILEHWIIPSKEIHSATNGFCNDHLIGGGGFGGVYKAKLFHFDVRKYVRINGSQNSSAGGGGIGGYPRRRSTVAIKKLDSRYGQGKREFLQEIEVLSRLKHRNLVSLLGFCDHDGDMILVYEHASNGSLDRCINNRRRVYSHTWAQRLQICLDVAYGLSYLHNLGIIHRDIKSANILLGHNLEGVIGDFGLSRTSKHQNVEFSMTNVAGTPAYIDPEYFRTGELTKQSDVYSYGVVLWEVLCGKLAILPKIGDDQEYLLHLAKRHFIQKKLNLIIDPQLREEFDKSSSNPGNKNFEDSIKTFAAIAYDCLDAKAKQLTMDDVVKELKKAWTFHVTGVEMFSLNTIESATSGFSEEHVIGKGTLGKVYIGTLSVSMQPKVVAIKRLEMVGSYEEGGFFKDVAMMSSYIHDNIIPFHGFCEEANEMILVFEHASNRSLHKHLDNSTLTWRHRLKISIGIAHGLQYIHSCVQPHKAIHGDIKSSHILLDDVSNATISDFIISKCEGTLGYRDPEYQKTGVLTRHSDVYAFGVVLFELLSGRPAIEDVENGLQHTSSRIFNADRSKSSRKDKDEKVVFLAQLAARCFEGRELEAIIFQGIKEKADPNSIDIFSAIAYQCLQQNKENRPTMARVIEELQKAFNSHDEWEWEQKLPRDYNRIIEMSKHPVPSSITKKDLHCLLSSGILLSKENVAHKNLGCVNHHELGLSTSRPSTDSDPESDEPDGPFQIPTSNRIGTRFAIPATSWKTENKWLMVELFRFVNKDQTTDFEVLLESFSRYYCGSLAIFVEGIEFRPVTVDAVVNKEIKDEKDVQGVYKSESDMHFEEKLGNDYHEVINRSQSNPVNTSKEELNALLSEGILIDEGEKLFSVSKVSMKKCYMLSAKSVIFSSPNVKCSIRVPPSQSRCRFAEAVEILSHYEFRIKCSIERELLSPNTNYGCFLVFQISEECRGLKGPVKGRNLLPHKNKETNIISFRTPSQVNLEYFKWIPAEREDGWMEVIVWEIHSENEQIAEHIPMDMKLTNFEGSMSGLIVCGIEFRAI